MLYTVIVIYCTFAAFTSLVVSAEYQRLRLCARPTLHRVALMTMVGLLWPVLVVGALQLGSIAVVAKTAQH